MRACVREDPARLHPRELERPNKKKGGNDSEPHEQYECEEKCSGDERWTEREGENASDRQRVCE